MLAFPTITKPSIKLPTELADPAIRSPMMNGMTSTRAGYTRIPRDWSPQWPTLPDAELGTLLTFYDTVKGGSASFTWSDDFGNNYIVRFASKIRHESVLNNCSSVSFDLAEV